MTCKFQLHNLISNEALIVIYNEKYLKKINNLINLWFSNIIDFVSFAFKTNVTRVILL